MTDTNPAGDSPHTASATVAPREPFPVVRLFYALGFGIVAWFVFWIAIVLALAQFVVIAINGKANDELKHFSLNLVQYLWELLAFVTFVRDEQPFPIGPFPKQP